MPRLVTRQPTEERSSLNRKRLAVATIAVLIVSLTTGLTANASAADLNGAGSTLVAPLMAQWAQDFEKRTGKSVNCSSSPAR